MPPPPYASIELGAAAAAPGAWMLAASVTAAAWPATSLPSSFLNQNFPPVAAETSFQGDFPVPPPYSVATSLPTYDEAEKAKAAAMAASAVEVMARVRLGPRPVPARPTRDRTDRTFAFCFVVSSPGRGIPSPRRLQRRRPAPSGQRRDLHAGLLQ